MARGEYRTLLFDILEQAVVVDVPGSGLFCGEGFVAAGTLYDDGWVPRLDPVVDGQWWLSGCDLESVTVTRPDGSYRLALDGAVEKMPEDWVSEWRPRREKSPLLGTSARGSTIQSTRKDDEVRVDPVNAHSFKARYENSNGCHTGFPLKWYEIEGEEWLALSGRSGLTRMCHLETGECFDTSTMGKVFDDGRVVVASGDAGFELRRLTSPTRR